MVDETKSETKKYVSLDTEQIAQVATENEAVFQSLRLKNTEGFFKEFKDGKAPNNKEPTVEFSARAFYNTEKIMWFVELAKQSKAKHVSFEMSTNQPIKLQFSSEDELNPEKNEVFTTFWLAPRVDDSFKPEDYTKKDKKRMEKLEAENKELKERIKALKEKMSRALEG